MTWLQPHRKRCYVDFLKVPSNKNEGRKTPSHSSHVYNDLQLREGLWRSLMMRKENRKSKTIALIIDY